MNFERIQSTVDVQRMQNSRVTVVGGANSLAKDLVRSGLKRLTMIDFDMIDSTNPARQDLDSADIGRFKVEAVNDAIHQINPDAQVNCLTRDFCDIAGDEFDQLLGDSDLFVFATDFFPAQARGNLEVLRLNKPAIWIGLYRDGRAGEIIFYSPKTTQACYRCICSGRYRAFEEQSRNQVDPTRIPSAGTIMDMHLVDAIAGQLALGLLTAGADNRMGRLIEKLGNRNLLQVKIDPDYRLDDKDIFAEQLGDGPANFSFTTIALAMEPEQDCPDCAHLRRAKERSRCAA